MLQRPGLFQHPAVCWVVAGAWALAWPCAFAQQRPVPVLPVVTVTAKANPDPVEKSYRRIVRGMDLFEQHRARLAPQADLRFKLLPRQRGTDLDNITLDVVGSTMDFSVPVAPDRTFSLQRNRQALEEDAQVIPDRRRRSMTWRTEIRTPGLPPGMRRLGDLRLECLVGMEAGLVSGTDSLLGRMAAALSSSTGYCEREDPRYLFFADSPLFSVTLVHGARRWVLPVDRLYAGATSDAGNTDDNADCDCALLLDRSYFLPLGDRSWPDDTLVEIETMAGP